MLLHEDAVVATLLAPNNDYNIAAEIDAESWLPFYGRVCCRLYTELLFSESVNGKEISQDIFVQYYGRVVLSFLHRTIIQ